MHPVLFRLPWFSGGSIPFHAYGVLLGLSLVVGWYLTLGLGERDGLPREPMANCYVDTALAALVGARLLFVATNPAEFTSFASLVAFKNGGLVAYGGFLGGLVGAWMNLRFGVGFTALFRKIAGLFAKEKPRPWPRFPLLPWADVAAPSLAAGLTITRLGCYLFGCDFGRPLGDGAPAFLRTLGTFPRWPEGAVDVGDGAPAWAAHVRAGLIPRSAGASLPVHPTQLYESLTGLVLLVALLALRRYQRFRGEVFLWFVFLYGAARYVLELVRDDADRGDLGPSLAPHILFPIGLGVLGLGYAMGIAPRLKDPVARIATQVAAFAPAVAIYVAYRPQAFAVVVPVRLSTSQAVAFVTGVAACVAFAILDRAALATPATAMVMPTWPEFDPPDDDEAAQPPKATTKETASATTKTKAKAKATTTTKPKPKPTTATTTTTATTATTTTETTKTTKTTAPLEVEKPAFPAPEAKPKNPKKKVPRE